MCQKDDISGSKSERNFVDDLKEIRHYEKTNDVKNQKRKERVVFSKEDNIRLVEDKRTV